MNRFALGRYARVMPKSLMSRYYKLSQTFIVRTLFAKFGDFKGQTYKIWNCKPDKRGFNIGGYIHSASGVPIIDVKWWLRKTRSGKFIVSDLGVASFRLKIEQRNTFVPIIRKNGGNPKALLTYLKNQIAENT
jgi:ABC-type transporter MlaC component